MCLTENTSCSFPRILIKLIPSFAPTSSDIWTTLSATARRKVSSSTQGPFDEGPYPTMKCQCPSKSHRHKPGKCNDLTTEPDGLCDPCRDKTAQELSTITEQVQPLARISKRERVLKTR